VLSEPARSLWQRRGAVALAIVTVGLLLLSVVAFLGARWWVFDLVANLRVQLMLLLTLIALPALMTRRWWVSAAAVAGAMLNLAVVAPLLFGSPEPPPAAGEHLDITFFNTKIRAEVDMVIAHLASRDDDIVVLTATTPSWFDRLEDSSLPLHVVAGSRLVPGLEIIVLARDPDAEVTIHARSSAARDALVEATIELDGGPVHVLGTHPVSPLTPLRAERRDLALEWIGSWPKRRDAPVVVVGDLNATPWSAPFRRMLDRSGLADSLDLHGIQPSWPAGLGPLGIPIDHVLHSPELTAVERELGPSFGSDHRMVHARIARVKRGPLAHQRGAGRR
jgi:endonuclease/exonuclease/phosphatase (EEP) superfamily protein YafD